MFNVSKNKTQLTTQEIEKYIEVFKTTYLPHLQKMKRYYDGKNDKIMNRTFSDSSKPNNKYCSPYCSYISNVLSGYFNLGGVTYTSQNEPLLAKLQTLFYEEDAKTKNNQLALDSSIYGCAYELLYINENKEVSFDVLNPCTVITIYDNTIAQELKFAIRFWTQKDILSAEETTYIEVYSANEILYYERKYSGGVVLVDSEPHYFKKVPINIYRNTKSFKGDFDKLISSVDAYDIAISDTLNDRQALNDSYLVFRNTNIDNEDIKAMKENKVIQIEDSMEGSQSSVDWLTKDTVSAEAEALKDRLSADIEKFSYISELEVKSHTSATGSSLQLIGLESIVQQKEYYARKALINRIQMIINFYNLLGEFEDCSSKDISITFVRNMPLDMNVMSDIASKLNGIISKETLLSQLPFITDVQLELERINKENELNSYDSSFLEDEVGE